MVTYLYKVTEFPWGTCTFAEFYMSQFENKLLSQNDKKSNPIFYVRHVDNILTFFKKLVAMLTILLIDCKMMDYC